MSHLFKPAPNNNYEPGELLNRSKVGHTNQAKLHDIMPDESE